MSTTATRTCFLTEVRGNSQHDTVSPVDALHIVEFFVEVADEMRTAIGNESDWGLSGQRPGQYTIDLSADHVALTRLDEAGFGVLSEESGVTGADRDILVVVDPIDGSTNASARLPWYATSMCAVDADGMLAAVVVNQATGDRWHAIRGGGAFRNGEPIAPGDPKPLAASLIAVSGLPAYHFGWGQFRCYGAAALDICAVADGTFDAFIDLSIDAHGGWDYMGAMLILQESGGAIVDWHDRDLVVAGHSDRRTPIAASNSALLTELRQAAANQHK